MKAPSVCTCNMPPASVCMASLDGYMQVQGKEHYTLCLVHEPLQPICPTIMHSSVTTLQQFRTDSEQVCEDGNLTTHRCTPASPLPLPLPRKPRPRRYPPRALSPLPRSDLIPPSAGPPPRNCIPHSYSNSFKMCVCELCIVGSVACDGMIHALSANGQHWDVRESVATTMMPRRRSIFAMADSALMALVTSRDTGCSWCKCKPPKALVTASHGLWSLPDTCPRPDKTF